MSTILTDEELDAKIENLNDGSIHRPLWEVVQSHKALRAALEKAEAEANSMRLDADRLREERRQAHVNFNAAIVRAEKAEGERDEAVAFHNAREAEYLREVQRGGEWNDRALKAESELDELRLRHATDAVVAQRDTRTVTPLIDHSSIAAVVREIIAEGVTFIPDAKFAEQRAAEKAAMDEQTRIYVERDAEDKAWRKLIIERDDRRHLEMGALMIRAAQVQALTKQGCMDYGEWSYQQVARDAKQAIAACREPVSEASVDMPPGARDQGNAPDSEEMAVLFRENRRLTIALAAAEARIAAARKACEEYSEAGIVGEMMLRALAGEP